MFNILGHIVSLLDSNFVFYALNFRSNQELFICSLSSNIGNAFKKQTTFDIKIQLNGESWRTQTKKINRHNYLFINFLFRVLQGSLSCWILIFRKWAVGCKLSCLFRKVPWRCMIKNLSYSNLAVPAGLITRIYIFLRINSRYEVRNALNNTGLCYLFHISNCHLVR